MQRSARFGIAGVVGLVLLLTTSFVGGAVADRLITGADVKDRSLAGKDLTSKAIGSRHVKDRSLGLRDLRRGVRPKIVYVNRNVTTTAFPAGELVPAPCPEGTQVINGYILERDAGYGAGSEHIDPAQNAFVVRLFANGDQPGTATIQLVCLQ